MYEDITYKQLQELPVEKKKEAIIELKSKYPSYKEMAQAVGGAPVALSNLYLRLVEGKKMGRKKKGKSDVKPNKKAKKNMSSEPEKPLVPAVYYKKVSEKNKKTAPDSPEKHDDVVFYDAPAQKQQETLPPAEPKKAVSFNIGLEIETVGEEIKNRIQGVASSLLNNKTYKIKINVEEV